MNKHLLTGTLSLACLAALSGITASAQTTGTPVQPAAAQPIATPPQATASGAAPAAPVAPAAPAASSAASPATQPAEQPSRSSLPPLPPPDQSGIRPESLPAVKRLLANPQKWQTGVEQVLSRIEVPDLRKQLTEGMNNLAPKIAQGLLDHKGDIAFVTVAVYREPGTAGVGQNGKEAGRQAALALAFEGFGSRLDGTFYGRVLADMPWAGTPQQEGQQGAARGAAPGAAQGAAPATRPASPASAPLVLDTRATWYLCFYLDNNGLGATPIPHELMKEELATAFKENKKAAPVATAQDFQDAAVKGELDQEARQRVIQQQTADLDAQLASNTYTPSYDTGGTIYSYPSNQPYYYGDWGLYGWGWYNPVYILPGRPFHHDWHDFHHWNWRSYHWHPDGHANSHPQNAQTTVHGTAGTAGTATGSAESVPAQTNAQSSAPNPVQPAAQGQPVVSPRVTQEPVRRPAEAAPPARAVQPAREPAAPRQAPVHSGASSTPAPSRAGGGAPAGGAAGHNGGGTGGAAHGGSGAGGGGRK